MFKKTLHILFCMYCFLAAQGQSCFLGGITFSTQEQIDNFPIDNPNCIEIGRILITGTDINNLEPLSQLEQVQGSLIIKDCPALLDVVWGNQIILIRDSLVIENNLNLITIDGFNSITNLENLYIGFNPLLMEIDGFESLESVSNDMTVRGENIVEPGVFESLNHIGGALLLSLNKFDAIDGFNTLQQIEGDFICNVDSVKAISGFNSLIQIDGNFRVQSLRVLENIEGLFNLGLINGVFVISGTSLANFTGLHSLHSINGGLVVGDHKELINFQGLESLTTIKNQFRVSMNPKLVSLKGLQNVSFMNPDFLLLANNPSLNSCSIKGLCESLNNFESGGVGQNGIGCSSNDELLARCTLDSTFIQEDICLGETLNIGGQTYTEIGFYEQTLSSCLGLDSVLNITIVESNDCGDCYASIPVLGIQIMKEKETYVIEFEDHTRKQFESIDNLVVFLEKTISTSNALRSNKNKLHFRTTQLEQLLINLKPGGVLKM